MAEYLEVADEFHVWLGERGEDGSIVRGSTDTIITVCDLDDQPIIMFAREDIFTIASWLSSLPIDGHSGT